jgi:phospholipid/cholesterol/gamma-HCH transport system permease protein
MSAISSNPPIHWFPLTRSLLRGLGKQLRQILKTLGFAFSLGVVALGSLRHRAPSLRAWLLEMRLILMGCGLLGLLLSCMTAVVIALQVAQEMVRQGAGNYVGALVALSMVRELAPIMTGFAVLALVGSSHASELASMRANAQLDALQVLHINPIRYLVLPRLLAGMIGVPLLTILTTVASIWAGLWCSVWVAGISPEVFLESVMGQIEIADVGFTCLKALIFGSEIVLLSCAQGLLTGAKGEEAEDGGGGSVVGRATTAAVVWSFVTMTLTDFLLSYFFYGSG